MVGWNHPEDASMPHRLLLRSLPLLLLTGACAKTFPDRNPIGENFPIVTGASLQDESVTLPTAHEGAPAP